MWHLGTAASNSVFPSLFLYTSHFSLPVLSHKHHYIYYFSAGGIKSVCVFGEVAETARANQEGGYPTLSKSFDIAMQLGEVHSDVSLQN